MPVPMKDKPRANLMSLDPEDAMEVAGRIEDANLEIKEAHFELFDYGGTQQPIPALAAAAIDDDGEEYTLYWSMGKASDWLPTPDGDSLQKVGHQEKLSRSSNGMIFLSSLINAGFPGEELKKKSIKVLVGLYAHFTRVPAPKRNLPSRPMAEGRAPRDESILIVDKILRLPWEEVAKPGKATAKKGTKTLPSVKELEKEEEDEETSALRELVIDILKEQGGSCDAIQLVSHAHRKLKGDPQRNAKTQAIFAPELLESGPWTYADGVVTIKEEE